MELTDELTDWYILASLERWVPDLEALDPDPVSDATLRIVKQLAERYRAKVSAADATQSFLSVLAAIGDEAA